MDSSAYSLPVTGPGNPAWLDQVLQGPGAVATAQFSEDPFIKLRKKLAADQKAALDRRRAADDAVLPQIIEDYKQSSARADAIMQRIDVAMGSLNAPPPQMGPAQLNQGEGLTGILTALIAPESLGQVNTALMGAAQQRKDIEMENTLRAYGLTRETAKMAVSQLMGRLDREYGVMDNARKQELALRHASALAEAGIIEKGMEQEFMLAMEEFKQDGLNERAAMAAALKEVGYAQEDIKLKLKEWELKNIKKPDTDSKIAKRDADVEIAKANLARLQAKDKQQLAIATQRLRAEFGRLSESQKRTAIAERALGLTGFNAETNRYNAQLRAWEDQVRALGLFEQSDTLWEMLVRPDVPNMPSVPQITLPNAPAMGGRDWDTEAQSGSPISGPIGGKPPKKNSGKAVRSIANAAKSFLGLFSGKGDIRADELRKKYKY